MPATESKFKSLVENETLYNSNFRKHFGITGVPWLSETWRQRESALAHDMVCVLLCNLPADTLIDDRTQNEIESKHNLITQKKKTKVEEDSFSQDEDDVNEKPKLQYIYNNYSPSEDEDEYDEEIESSFESELESDEEIGERLIGEERAHLCSRYRLLKGLSVPSRIQNLYMKRWKLEPKRKIYDIIDKREKKIIEIKFSMNAYERKTGFSNHPETDEFTSLILVHPGTANIDYINKIDKMPGTKRATNWILQRKSVMNSLELSDCVYDEEEYYKEFIYSNPSMNKLFLEFRKLYCKMSNSENLLDLDIAKLILQPIDIELSLLTEKASKQILNVEEPDISWDGNLLPPCWKNYIDVENNDRYSIDEFLNTFEDYKVTSILGDSKLYECYKQVIRSYDKINTPYDNYAFLKCKKRIDISSVPKEIRSALKMNEWAQAVNNPIGTRKYNKWFDHLVDKLAQEHPFQQEYTFIMASEIEEYTEMYKNSKVIMEKFNKILSSTYVGIMISETENLYTRLCGAYLTSKEEYDSRIAVLPIRSTFYKMNSEKKYETKHRVSGIVVRGPTDAPRMSDKTNLVSIEIVNEDFKASYLKESCIVEFDSGQRLVIRQGTYKNLGAPHITCNRNLLVNPFNLLIDVFNVRTRQKSKLQIETICEEFFGTYENSRYFVNRVIENTLMGLIGSSRDEMYFLMLRQELLSLIYRRRRWSSGLRPNIKEFCDSISKYLIDNPLSMYCHNNLLNILNVLCLKNTSIDLRN